MTLKEWLRSKGRGECSRLVREALVSYPTIREAQKGNLVSDEIAQRISAATGGAVSAASMKRGTGGVVSGARQKADRIRSKVRPRPTRARPPRAESAI